MRRSTGPTERNNENNRLHHLRRNERQMRSRVIFIKRGDGAVPHFPRKRGPYWRRQMTTIHFSLDGSHWVEIKESEIPRGIRFAPINPGHIVETSYGDRGMFVPGSDAPYKRVHDHSEGAARYYVRARLTPGWQDLAKRKRGRPRRRDDAPGARPRRLLGPPY